MPVANVDAVLEAKRTKELKETAFKIGIASFFHPLQVTKVLIQLGYEPWPLDKGRSFYFFGREQRYLPNGFIYANRLSSYYGYASVFRGLGASICGNFLGAASGLIVSEKVAQYYGFEEIDESTDVGSDPKKFMKKVVRGSVKRTAGIIVARPFQVVMIRMIAQHIGGEEVYLNIFGSIRQIYKEEGLTGLFAGLLPQLACELCTYWTVSGITYLIEQFWKSYIENERGNEEEEEEEEERLGVPPKAFKGMIGFAVPYVVNSIFYPLNLVSTVMAVNNSGLVAGQPPFIPIYPTWRDCFQDLSAKDQLKRGSKMFFRFYDKPITYRYGGIYALPNA